MGIDCNLTPTEVKETQELSINLLKNIEGLLSENNNISKKLLLDAVDNTANILNSNIYTIKAETLQNSVLVIERTVAKAIDLNIPGIFYFPIENILHLTYTIL